MTTIRLFMWGYQKHFQIAAKVSAEALFRKLNPEFEVEVFLLGLRRKDDQQQHPVCLEPEDCGFKPEDFASVREDADHRYAVDPERNLMGMIQSHHDAMQRRVKNRATHEAVLAVLNGWRRSQPGEYHFSGFLPVADYDLRRPKGSAMRVRQIPKARHLEIAEFVDYEMKSFADDKNVVIGEKEFHPLRFLFVGKFQGFDARPRQSQFLALPLEKRDGGDRVVI